MCQKCNGWANYPTWAVMLWDQNGYSVYEEIAANVLSDGGDTIDLARALKEYNTENAPILVGAAGDILTWAMGQIDWYGIANHLAFDWKEEQEEKQEAEQEEEQGEEQE